MRWPTELDDVLDRQRGLVTLAQALSAGVSRSALRWAHGRTCQHVLPRVLATFTGSLDPHQRLVAGQLWAGPGAQVASRTAAAWHGLEGFTDDGVVRLLVDGGTPTRAGFAVRRRTTRLDPHPWRRGPLVLCSPARALVDAARELRSDDAVRQVLVAAVQQRKVRERDLVAQVEGGARQGSARVRRALTAVASGAWSLPEVEVLDELARSTVLPRVWANPTLVGPDGARLPPPDFWLDDVALAGQVHSRAFHLRDADWDRTVRSDSRLTELGVCVLAVTPADVRRDPVAFRRRVEQTYLRLRSAGRRPGVRMVTGVPTQLATPMDSRQWS